MQLVLSRLQYLPVASAHQLGIIVGCISGGIVKYTEYTCRSLMDPIQHSLLFVFPFARFSFWLSSRLYIHQPTFLTFISLRNWLCATATLVHAGAQRRSSTDRPVDLSAWLRSTLSTAPNPRLSTFVCGCCMIARGGGQQIAIRRGPTWQGHIGDYMRHAS